MINQLVWQPLNRPELGLMNSISTLIHHLELSQPSLLTTVRLGPTLFLSTDFSGQHDLAEYESYSFLIADLIYLWLWDDMRKETRSRYFSDKRRMSFKGLNDAQKKRALIPFLRAANCIPGLSITLLVDKSIPSLLSPDGKLDMSHPEYKEYQHWKPHTFEKLLRVVHFAAMLIAGLSAPGQNLIWITDEDEIAPNEERLVEACGVIEHIMNHYLAHNLGRVQFGTTKSDDGGLALEDLAAIPDFVAGALCDLAPTFARRARGLSFVVPKDSVEKEKVKVIVDWFADPIHTLKKLVVSLDYEKGNVTPSCIYFQSSSHAKEFFWHEEFLKRVKGV